MYLLILKIMVANAGNAGKCWQMLPNDAEWCQEEHAAECAASKFWLPWLPSQGLPRILEILGTTLEEYLDEKAMSFDEEKLQILDNTSMGNPDLDISVLNPPCTGLLNCLTCTGGGPYGPPPLKSNWRVKIRNSPCTLTNLMMMAYHTNFWVWKSNFGQMAVI